MSRILILIAVDLIDSTGNIIAANPGEVHDVDARQAKGLVKAGQADDNPIAVAWHSNDMDTYNRLVVEQEAAVSQSGASGAANSSVAAGAGAGTGTGTGAGAGAGPAAKTDIPPVQQ